MSAEEDCAEDRAIDTCIACPKLCRWACPVAEAEARESTSPRDLVTLGGYLKRGLATIEAVGEFPYHCTSCGACTDACLHRNDVPALVAQTRARIMEARAAPQSVKEVCGHFGIAGNAQGRLLVGELERVLSRVEMSIAREGTDIYFPGCSTLDEMPEAASAFLRAASLFGLRNVACTELSASCCGLPLLWAGDVEGFRLHATRFANNARGIERLVVHDPACAHALAVHYPAFGVELEPVVEHVSRFLSDAMGNTEDPRANVRFTSGRARDDGPRAAYMDVCNLARGLGIVDEPRRLLAEVAGHDVVELGHLVGKSADCCGAAGLLPVTAPETARRMAEERLRTFRETGADRLVTCSPRCAAHLLRTDRSAPVVDLCMLLARL